MSGKVLGLEIGEAALSAVLIRAGLRNGQILAHCREPLAEDLPAQEALDRALRTLADRMPEAAGATLLCALPSREVGFRNHAMPFRERGKIGQTLAYELEPMIPQAPEETVFDFQIVRQGENSEILSAVIEKDRLQGRLDTLAARGLSPEVVTVGGYALAQRLAEGLDSGARHVALLDCGPQSTTLFLLWQRRVLFARRLAAGRDTPRLGEALLQTLAVAEELLKQPVTLERIFHTAAETPAEGWVEALQRSAGVPVQAVDLLADPALARRYGRPPRWPGGGAETALALALAGVEGRRLVNFRSNRAGIRKALAEHKRPLAAAAALALMAGVLAMATVWVDLQRMERQVARLDDRIESLFRSRVPQVTRIVDPLAQLKTQIQASRQQAFNYEPADVRVIDLLDELSRGIPSAMDVEIARLVFSRGSLTLQGSTNAFNLVDEIKKRIEGSRLVHGVTIHSAKSEKGSSRVGFELKVDVSKPGASVDTAPSTPLQAAPGSGRRTAAQPAARGVS